MKEAWFPGKILLAGEYAVLDGALALAIPTRLGQRYRMTAIEGFLEPCIHWTAHAPEGKSMDAVWYWQKDRLDIHYGVEFSRSWHELMQNVQALNPKKLLELGAVHIETFLEFPKNYGLGSSSTLTAILSDVFEIDAYELNDRTFKSSGYDVAVALEKSALVYRRNAEPHSEKVILSQDFLKDLIFIHLNAKQNSRDSIKSYSQIQGDRKSFVESVSLLTQKALMADSMEEWEGLMSIHEQTIGAFLGATPVKEKLFSDCPVFVKSLGGWGGDFVMSRKFDAYEHYFSAKGLETIIEWNALVYEECQEK